VFDTLFAKYGARFDATVGKELAREVIDLLGWTDLEKYEAYIATVLV
jgi:hypothetical protein